MTIKKTIGISIAFHVILFSAALLFSAGLFKGSGNKLDENVFFVKLAAEKSQGHSNDLMPENRKSKVKKVAVAKLKKKPEATIKKLVEPVMPDVPLDKAPEPVEEHDRTKDDLNQESLDQVVSGDKRIPDRANAVFDGKDSIIQAALAGTSQIDSGTRNGPARHGLSPEMIDLIGSAIDRAKSYPMLARRRGIEGTVYVSFRINENGDPDEIEIKKSSGHRILDSATVKVIQKAAPYPAVNNRVEVPVAYRLSKR